MQVQLILFFIAALLVAAFALQNTMPVIVKILFWEANLSLVIVIIGSAALGAISLFAIDMAKQLRVNREMKEVNEKLEALTKEKEELERNLAAYTQGIHPPAPVEPAAQEPPLPDEGESVAQDRYEATTLEELDQIIDDGHALE